MDESSPAIVVRIRPQALSGPPYRIENLSLQRIRFRQCVHGSSEDTSGEILLPYHVRPYVQSHFLDIPTLDNIQTKTHTLDILI